MKWDEIWLMQSIKEVYLNFKFSSLENASTLSFQDLFYCQQLTKVHEAGVNKDGNDDEDQQ